MSSREMGKVMEKAVKGKGVYRKVIYGMDPQVMLPMILETGILTVDGYDPYYNKLTQHGEPDEDINERLLDILFTRDKWWNVFIRVCGQCGYHGIIQAIEEKLTATQRSELRSSTRQRRGEVRRGEMSHSERIRQGHPDKPSSDSNQFSETNAIATTPTLRDDPTQGNMTWEGGQWEARYESRNSNIGPSPDSLIEAQHPRLHMRTQVLTSQSGSERRTKGQQELSDSDSRQQFDQLSWDSNTFTETKPLAKASTQRADPTHGTMPWGGVQWEARYDNTQMNSDIGRSPGSLIDDEKKITIKKETIDIQKAENNFEDAFKDFTISKKDTDKTSPIIWNIIVRANNAVDPNSNLTTGGESNMHKVNNLSSLENNTLQSYPGEDESDTPTVNDDATMEWKHDPHPSFHSHPIDSHHDDREGGVTEKVMQSSPAMDGSNMAPYVSNLIIQSQLDQQRKHDGASIGQETVNVEYQSTEGLEIELPKEKGRHRVPGSRYHHPKEHYHTESTSVKSHYDEKTHCDPESKVINTEMAYQEEPMLAGTEADCDIPRLSGPVDVSGNACPVGNIPHFGLIEGETSPIYVMSDRPGHDRLHIADNGTYLAEPYNVMSDKKRSRGSTCTQPVNVRSNTPQQAYSPLRETSDGSVRLSSHYHPSFGDSPVPNYTHIQPPVHIVSMSETSEPPSIHEALAEMTLTRMMDGAST
ncbi:uncharacterized protein [Haliotis cracherodii]|uniref:uncharacterized protein n=1 Tax=Haliotis cracherodii TaxID=6455 RepID=UPI0039E902A1